MRNRQSSDALVVFLVVLVFATLISLGIWWQVSLWDECRSTNSFWYCVRILGR
jgi:cytochrome oxidase assembly protein ShyY1